MHLTRLSAPLLVLFLTAAALPAADERKAAPSAEEQARAEKMIRQLFSREYAVRSLAGYRALAVKLMDQGAETKDDPISRYVLYREASVMAAAAGDVDLAVRAVNEISKHYTVSGAALKARAFEIAAERFSGVEASRMLAERALAAAGEGLDADDYDAVTRLLKLASTTASKARSIPLISSAQARTKEAEALKAEYEKLKAVLDKLKEKPDDPDANLTAGQYYCFQKGNWDVGLPHLTRGSNPQWKVQATNDLTAPTETSAQIELGESWLAVSKSEKDLAAKHMRWRARFWFEKALSATEGETREKLEAYLKDIPPRAGSTALARVNLSDMEEFDVKIGYGKFSKGGRLGYNLAGRAGEADLTVDGKKYTNTVSAHPPSFGDSVVKFRLGKVATEFRASVALNDTASDPQSPITFKVLGDGKELWASKPVQAAREIQDCVVKVAGVDVLELRTHCPGIHNLCHPVWLDPYVMTTAPAKSETRPPPADDTGKQFVGVWVQQNVAGHSNLSGVFTMANQGGRWVLQVQYLRNGQVVGVSEGSDLKYADGKLTFALLHIKKVAANWEDTTNVATVSGDRMDLKWKTRGSSGTVHLTRVKR